ncbi:MAG TPA: GlxA family transcriptional regulator [Thermoleophilaceae bacterium]|nr:GlxA family transcriptional regulator [Thermoleophilaceae bacterium]
MILGFHECQSLDVVGPAEVFATAGSYEVEVVAPSAEPFFMSNGMRVMPAAAMDDVRGPIDTLIVAGGAGSRDAASDDRVLQWVRSAAKRSRRVTSVCTGAFVLAAAGLLDGRRATTHWQWCDLLSGLFPAVEVERDAIYVVDGPVYTSAGVTAGMDLALALVEEDLGPRVARDVAQQLVIFLRRPGGQSQFSAPLAALPAEHEPLRDLQAWIPANVGADLSVPALAERVAMSPRNFARTFRRETGVTPAAYVESIRVEQARIALEGSQAPIETIAIECGFGTVETMRRAFHRRLGVGPGTYRSRFHSLMEEVA